MFSQYYNIEMLWKTALVAQRIEQRTPNAQVARSSRAEGTKGAHGAVG